MYIRDCHVTGEILPKFFGLAISLGVTNDVECSLPLDKQIAEVTLNAISGCSSSDQADSSLSPVSDKEINIHGEDCVGSVKTVTKFVKIFSPGLYDTVFDVDK